MTPNIDPSSDAEPLDGGYTIEELDDLLDQSPDDVAWPTESAFGPVHQDEDAADDASDEDGLHET